MNPQLGMRVLVPFGKKKIHTGILYRWHTESEEADRTFEYKEIYCLLDSYPILTPTQLKLWEWIADYYMCTLGEVMKAALPTALKPESETRVFLEPDFIAAGPLPRTQQQLLDTLADGKPHSIEEITRSLDVRSVLPHINTLLEMGAISVEEHVSDRYVPKTEHRISLAPDFPDAKLGPRQQELLRFFLGLGEESISRTELIRQSGCSLAIVKGLVEKGIFVDTTVGVDRLQEEGKTAEAHPLSPAQQTAYDEISASFLTHNTTLLHGVTSSGKTEVYIRLIEEQLRAGKQVLYLVPEIALTTQLTDRLRRVFGEKLGVYHSKFSDQERVETYKNILFHKKYEVVIGVRSSLFLPFDRLGLIIIDEEHDASYKQQDPAPRYHARSAGIILAGLHGAKTLLGTATPALETYYNACSGKFGLVRLTERYRGLSLPEIHLIDLQRQYHRKEMYGHFSDPLHDRIREELQRDKQVIIFQNRRGYSNYMECKQCAYVPKCVNCDVSLTEHKFSHTLVCHYCGYTIPVPNVCPACHQPDTMADRGFGTERIEDEVKQFFPEAKAGRMDLDTTRTKNGHKRLIRQFAEKQINVLIGTQMVTKGLHFDDVSLVAVLRADALLNQPDFRAYERAYQMLEQVAGRAGRKPDENGRIGQVVIQTTDPQNPIFGFVRNHDYEGFYRAQLRERELFRYPPFYRIIGITLRHHELSRLEAAARTLHERLSLSFGNRCSGIVVPAISKVQNQHHRQLTLKIEATASYQAAKQILRQHIDYVLSLQACKGTAIIADVDTM